MDPVVDFATRLAQKAGGFLRQNFNTRGIQAYVKTDRSAVTDIDLATDRLIAEEIKQNFPNEGFLSEEISPTYTSESPAAWVIDPLDGTTNYALGLPFWGVSIARLQDGYPDLAGIYFPPLDEMYVAQRNQGAFLNGERIQVKPPLKAQPFSFFSCCSRTHRLYTIHVPYKSRILGSAAYSLCSLGKGMAVLAFEATAKIWDIAGAWLVVTEAGGIIGTLDGSQPFPLIPGTDYSTKDFPILGAATASLAARARQQILPK